MLPWRHGRTNEADRRASSVSGGVAIFMPHAPHGVRILPRNANFSKLSLAERDLWYIEYRLPQY